MRGLRKGVEAARLWATRPPGGVQQTIELEQLYEDEAAGNGTAVALIRRRWRWDEDGSEAGEDEMAWLFELRDNRVALLAPLRGPGGGVGRRGLFSARSSRTRSSLWTSGTPRRTRLDRAPFRWRWRCCDGPQRVRGAAGERRLRRRRS